MTPVSDIETLPFDLFSRILAFVGYEEHHVPVCSRRCREMCRKDDVARSSQRNSAIQTHRRTIKRFQSDLAKLEAERDFILARAKVKTNPYRAWHMLTVEQKRNKELVLLALKAGHIPYCMRPEKFSDNFPHICTDRDIVLAQLSRYGGSPSFMVPKELLSDREIMLAACKRNADHLAAASKSLWWDSALVFAAVKSPSFRPDHLKYVSAQMLSSRRLVSAILQTSIGFRCLPFIASGLRNDKGMLLQALRHHPSNGLSIETASHIPSMLLNDKKVALALVSRSGICLKFLPDHFRKDEEIVRIACENNGLALQYCLLEKHLYHDRVLPSLIKNEGCGQLLVTSASSYLRRNRDLLLDALGSGLDPKALPLPTDRQFVLDAVARSGDFYHSLPDSIKKDRDVAMKLVMGTGADFDEFVEALENVPSLLTDRDVLTQIVSQGFSDVALEAFGDAPSSITSNKRIMQMACEVSGEFFQEASEGLRGDEELLKIAIESDPSAILYASLDLRVRNPGLFAHGIRANDWEDYWDILYPIMPPEVFADREVVLAWIEKGPVLLDVVEWDWGHFDFSQDQEIMLKIAELGYTDFFRENVSHRLRDDSAFMLRAVRINGNLLSLASPAVGYDFSTDTARLEYQLTLSAIGTTAATMFEFSHKGVDFDCLVDFSKTVRNMLVLHDAFVTFLGGIAILRPHVAPAKRCRLPILDLGPETTVAFKTLIAQFVGVPLGKELSLLRATSPVLMDWGY